MAGAKGRSGGPRANAGGARSGAGRKAKGSVPIAPEAAKSADGGFDPRPILEQVALGLIEVSAQQYKALTALLPYTHHKLGEGGKKERKADAAKSAAGGKFSPSAPPRLAAANGKKI